MQKYSKKVISILCTFAMVLTLLITNVVPTEAAGNDGSTFDKAIPVTVGQTYKVSWTKSTDDKACYNKITISKRGILTVRMTKPTSANGEKGNLYLEVYDANKKGVWASSSRNSDENLSQYEYSVGLNPGTYYFNVKPSFSVISGTFETSYTPTFQEDAHCEVEPDDTLSMANAMTFNQMYHGNHGNIGYSDYSEEDFYMFSVSSAKKVRIYFDNLLPFQQKTGWTLTLIDPSNRKTKIEDSFKKSGNGMYYYEFSAVKGTYYIWLYGDIVPTKYAVGIYDISEPVPAVSVLPTVNYCTHVQSYGWQGWVSDGAVAGTSGQAKRLEAIRINLSGTNGISGDIEYRTHVQSYGWQGYVKNGEVSGTSGQAKRLEGIQIRLTGDLANYYDVYYRVHAQTYGWLGWAKNDQPAGTSGQAKRLEAIQIKIVPKDTGVGGGQLTTYSFVDYGLKPSTSVSSGKVLYKTHVQSYGWEPEVSDGSVSGTMNQAKRLEGIQIKLNNSALGISNGGIQYKTHVQSFGWETSWKQDGQTSGTVGKSKRLEAIMIQLTGEAAQKYNVYYRVYVQSYGWLGWAKNGEAAGTEGMAKRLEAIQIVILPKDQSIPASGTPYYKK